MAKLEIFPLAAWVRFYSGFSVRSLERMQEALEDIENEKYSPQRLISDTVQFWNEASMGWWTALQETVSGGVPTLFVKMKTDTQSHPKASVAVDSSGSGKVVLSDVIRLGGPEPKPSPKAKAGAAPDPIEAQHLQVKMNTAGNRLNLAVIGLADSKAKGPALKQQPNFAPGLYQSLVHRDGKLLAVIQILVSDEE